MHYKHVITTWCLSFLASRTGDTALSAAPFAGHGRPRAASDTEDTPMIQKLVSDGAEGVGLTSSALKAQQRQLSGRKKLSSVLGFGDKKKTGLFGGSRGTRSVDQNRTTLEQERGKDKEKMKQLERESLSELSNNTKLLKVFSVIVHLSCMLIQTNGYIQYAC